MFFNKTFKYVLLVLFIFIKISVLIFERPFGNFLSDNLFNNFSLEKLFNHFSYNANGKYLKNWKIC